MGISLLTAYIESFSDTKQDYELHNTYVVIDSNNLMYDLYRRYDNSEGKSDFIFGGNYQKYVKHFEEYFKLLRKCKIEPILVIDGINQYKESANDKEFELTFNDSKKISKSNGSKGSLVDPYLLKTTFFTVINDLNIKYVRSRHDSDLDSAKLANELNCPLISSDSDFLVMNVRKGIISCEYIKKKYIVKSRVKFKKWSTIEYIKCKIYKIESFVQKFNGLTADMLPVFATFMGNDFIDGKVFNQLVQNNCKQNEIKGMDKRWHPTQVGSPQYQRWSRMTRILNWLATEFRGDVDRAMGWIQNYFSERMSGQKLKTTLKLIECSVNKYKVGTNGTYLKTILDLKGKETKLSEIAIKEILNEFATEGIPEWFLIEYFCDSYFDKYLIEIIFKKKLVLYTLVEDFRLQSCHECSEDLMSLIAGLVRTHDQDMSLLTIKTRNGSKIMKKEIIPKIVTNNGFNEIPEFGKIRDIRPEEREQLLIEFLELSYSDVTLLKQMVNTDQEFWTLFVIVVKYWKRKTKYERSSDLMRALVLNVIHYRCPELQTQQTKEFADIRAASVRSDLNIEIIHYYNEFQVCYRFISLLNALLGHPIGRTQFHTHLNGVMIHRLTENRLKVESSFSSYESNPLYSSLMHILNK